MCNFNRVTIYRQSFNELNFEGFDFCNGFKSGDVHEFEKLKNLSINIFELKFYQDQYKWKHNLTPIEICKNDTDRVLELLIYRNHYVLIQNLNVFLGKKMVVDIFVNDDKIPIQIETFEKIICKNWSTRDNFYKIK